MTKSMYLKLGIFLGIAAPIGQYILSRNTMAYTETKILLVLTIVVSLLQILCLVLACKKEKLQYVASMVGVVLFFVIAAGFMYLDCKTKGGMLPSGSTIFLWIPQAWTLKSLAKL
ncbi:MAG: hypothetical protein RR967_07415 [Anaerovoracaceae bacterium]